MNAEINKKEPYKEEKPSETVDAQKWLDYWHTKSEICLRKGYSDSFGKRRDEIKELWTYELNLTGNLDLSDFTNLEIFINNFKMTS